MSTENVDAAVDAAPMKKVNLVSADSEVFEVEVSLAMEAATIMQYLEDDACGDSIPVPNVSGEVLAKVLEFCRKHVEFGKSSAREEERKAFNEEFSKVEGQMKISLIHAANYLNIPHMMDFLCQNFADQIRDMTVEQVRDFFGIENDFTPEEEEEMRNKNSWAYEP